mmetsp:Transcript_8018/g.11880  ORF Transcript_8018/g.11880 Transcript_8018/m.11880 type:complete len:213 (-) Transcript_8018:108-746(-)
MTFISKALWNFSFPMRVPAINAARPNPIDPNRRADPYPPRVLSTEIESRSDGSPEMDAEYNAERRRMIQNSRARKYIIVRAATAHVAPTASTAIFLPVRSPIAGTTGPATKTIIGPMPVRNPICSLEMPILVYHNGKYAVRAPRRPKRKTYASLISKNSNTPAFVILSYYTDGRRQRNSRGRIALALLCQRFGYSQSALYLTPSTKDSPSHH